jgi:hypothetical protein
MKNMQKLNIENVYAIRSCIIHRSGREIMYILEVILGSGGDTLRS